MRVMSHLLLPRSALHRRFPAHALTAIEEAVEASERRHRGEIRVAIEVALDLPALWRVQTARERALEVFAELGVFATAESNGVLIYLLLAERDVEIVPDKGLHGRVTTAEWQEACTLIEQGLAAGLWRDGVLRGIERVGALLEREFPAAGPSANEQIDRPTIL
jgi:uncharacterized membrane protein